MGSAGGGVWGFVPKIGSGTWLSRGVGDGWYCLVCVWEGVRRVRESGGEQFGVGCKCMKGRQKAASDGERDVKILKKWSDFPWV